MQSSAASTTVEVPLFLRISSQASTSYDQLNRALIDRYGKRRHEYFLDLCNIKKEHNETYRGLNGCNLTLNGKELFCSLEFNCLEI
jgi:hypothetical protein